MRNARARTHIICYSLTLTQPLACMVGRSGKALIDTTITATIAKTYNYTYYLNTNAP